MRVDLLILAGAFAAGTLLAELAGARNTGAALACGQLAFGVAVVYVLVRRPQLGPPRPAPPRTGVPPAPAPRTGPRRPPPPPRKSRGSRPSGR